MKKYTKVADGIIAVEDSDADARREKAWSDAINLGALRTISADEASAYIDQQVTLNTTHTDALTLIDNIASVDDIKAILAAMVNIIFAIAGILKLMALLLIAIRDYVKPEITESETA